MTITGREVDDVAVWFVASFIKNIQVKNPSVVGTNCTLHHMALASRTLPLEMNGVFNLAITVVNYAV